MASYKLLMITGGIISVLGFLLMSTNTIYYEDTTRTFTELGIKLAIVGIGILIYKKGEHMKEDK